MTTPDPAAGSPEERTDGLVRQVVPLGAPPWPTIDPYLFCVHHLDRYPAGDARLGPDASLEGRQIGMDFAGRDGWRMYHGDVVPGFPQHPHRGFETVTIVRRGLVDHSDSLGATARYGRGDVQWLTAGAGIVHAEMFPLLDRDGPNTLELFQIWVNLPAADKLVEPHFTMLWDHDIPRVVHRDDAGCTTEVTVVAGTLDGRTPPAPPPASWASRPDADVAIWLVEQGPGARWALPPAAGAETVRTLYLYEGGRLEVAGEPVREGSGVVVDASRPVELVAGDAPTAVLVLQGRPIGEPVAQHGPFVMNDRQGVEQAFADYQRTGFGGWPWPVDGPVHGPEPERFALRADGTLERAEVPAAGAPSDGDHRPDLTGP